MPGPETKGGARPGAGRKANAEKYAEEIGGFTALAAAYLAEAFANLRLLAEGTEKTTQIKAAAGTVFRKDVLRKRKPDGEPDPDGDPVLDGKGKPIPIQVPAFPGIDPETLVVIKEIPTLIPPDFRANEYLADRVIGRPAQALELANGDDGPLKIQVVYEDADPPGEAAEAPCGPEEDPPGAEAV